MTISKRKLGSNCDDAADILNLRIKAGNLEGLIDNRKYFPAYHMNKKHWVTIILDGTVPLPEIYKRINESNVLSCFSHLKGTGRYI